jgi:microcystin-dependent protein
MAAPKQVDFVDGTTVVSADFLDRIQEVQAGLATNAALAISGTNVVMNAGSGNDVSAMVIDERMRYVESPQVVSFSGSDSSGSYSIWATTSDNDSNSGFTLVKTLGATTPTADNFRRVGTVSWDGSALSSLVQLAGYNKHGYMHTLASDPLPAGSVSSTQILDGTITLSDLAASLQQFLVPTGSVVPFAGDTSPSGFLLCNGLPHSRTTYAALFTALGGTSTPYGFDATTFNVPDLRGRVVAGMDNMGGTAAQNRLTSPRVAGTSLGAVGGVQSHLLTSAESGRPSGSTVNGNVGSLTVTGGDHTHSGTTNFGGGAHSHGIPRVFGAAGPQVGLLYEQRASSDNFFTTSPATDSHQHGFSIGSSGSHGHTITGGSHNHTIEAADASAAHTNVQPTIVMNYIIKV